MRTINNHFLWLQHNGWNGTVTNLLPKMSGICLKWLSSGVRVGENIKIFCNGRKTNNMTGRSGIGVLVAGFSRVGALKKHAPLVFSLDPWRTGKNVAMLTEFWPNLKGLLRGKVHGYAARMCGLDTVPFRSDSGLPMTPLMLKIGSIFHFLPLVYIRSSKSTKYCIPLMFKIIYGYTVRHWSLLFHAFLSVHKASIPASFSSQDPTCSSKSHFSIFSLDLSTLPRIWGFRTELFPLLIPVLISNQETCRCI